MQTDMVRRCIERTWRRLSSPEQQQATVKDFWSKQEPILTSMDQQAPDEIKADIEKLLAKPARGR
jgi:hypothetical protein